MSPISPSLEIDPGAAMYIVNITRSHPHYTQLLAHTVWEFQYGSQPGKIGAAEVDNAVERILDREETTFTNLWDNLTLQQKRLLLSLSLKKDSDKIFSADYIRRYNLSSIGTLQRGIKSLINKGVIDKEGESVEIDDVFLKLWLNKRMSYSIRQNF